MITINSPIVAKSYEDFINARPELTENRNVRITEQIPFEVLAIKTNMKIKGTKNECYVKTLWDTGATFCVISEKIADFIGLEIIGEDSVKFANNSEEILKIGVLSLVLSNGFEQPVRALISPDTTDDFLIGMNFIRSIKLCIEPIENGYEFSYELK